MHLHVVLALTTMNLYILLCLGDDVLMHFIPSQFEKYYRSKCSLHRRSKYDNNKKSNETRDKNTFLTLSSEELSYLCMEGGYSVDNTDFLSSQTETRTNDVKDMSKSLNEDTTTENDPDYSDSSWDTSDSDNDEDVYSYGYISRGQQIGYNDYSNETSEAITGYNYGYNDGTYDNVYDSSSVDKFISSNCCIS